MSTSRYVLDSFAVLAFIQREQGAEAVRELLQSAGQGKIELHMSVMNLAEVQYRLMREHPGSTQELAVVGALPITFASADEYISEIVQLKAKYPMSLADCFAAALAQDLDCPLVTGDREFRKVEKIIQIEWL